MAQRLGIAAAAGRSSAHEYLASHPHPSLAEAEKFVFSTIPAVPDEATHTAELAQVNQIIRNPSPAKDAAAEWYAGSGYPSFRPDRGPNWWLDQLGAYTDRQIQQLGPVAGKRSAELGAQLLKDALRFGSDIWSSSQKSSHEARPYVYNTKPPAGGWDESAYTSHPSGHATQTFVAAAVMSNLWPERSDEFNAVARRVAFSRLYNDMHFPHDVIIGARIGTMIGSMAAAVAPVAIAA